MCCLVATANAAPMDDANAAYRRGDYAQALKILRPLAAQGNAVAQFSLGIMYYNGRGVTQNYQEALKWYRAAARMGSRASQTSIGEMYYFGRGVAPDYQEAVEWYRLGAGLKGPTIGSVSTELFISINVRTFN
jgi:TPR repeat protein